MNTKEKLADALEGISAEMLAADASDKQSIAEIGGAIEQVYQDAAALPGEIVECLTLMLTSLQAVYQETVPDGQATLDAMAVVVGAAAEMATSEDSPPSTDDLTQACEALKAVQAATPAKEAEVSEVTPEASEASPQGATEAPARIEFAESANVLPDDADMELMGEFIVECVDHISAAEGSLLDLESNPEDVEQINTIFRAFHTIKGTSGFLGLERVQRMAHLAENLLDRARDGEITITGGYADLALQSCDYLRTMIEGLEGIESGDRLVIPETYDDLLQQLNDPEAAGVNGETIAEEMRLGDILVGQGKVERDAVESTVEDQSDKPIGKALVDAGVAKATDVANALRTQKKASHKSTEATIRVGTGRLDSLINMVGELVISHSMVTQDPDIASGSTSRLARNVSRAGKIIRELQDLTMSMRMVPMKGTFQKMARLVRDLARKAGKQVNFVIEGEETEIDRSMVEVLNDPLVHMMRNAVDHGVETGAVRQADGKDPVGTIRLKAYHSAGNVVIQLQDDGKGLDREKIIAKARSKGLIAPDRELTENEAFMLIFQPGFSTADKVTDISGRGVGMDVVKRGIESLRGRVEVSSTKGEGSTFTVRVPLTMAIADAMLLQVGKQRFLLPTISIEQSFRPKPDAVSTVVGRGEMAMVRGDLLPIFRLHELFNIEGAVTNLVDGLLIIIEGEGQRCALMVDDLLSQQQVVIKSLGESMGHIPGVAGGAILGDGQVGLILDAAGLFKLAASKDMDAVAA